MSLFVTKTEELDAVVRQIRGAECVAVDTEFVWERTYYPALGLVQLAVSESRYWLLDVPAIGDMAPLGRLLADGNVVKILHDAQQDLSILKQATGAYPCGVFDTRVAAGFGGLTSVLSLARLLEEVLGIVLAKTETRANWLLRPLSEKQIEYAIDDVRYLPRLRAALVERAANNGHSERLAQEMESFDAHALYDGREANEQYTRVRGWGSVPSEDRGVLRTLAAWREHEAERRNRPRGHVVPDAVLIAVAQRRPTTYAELRDCPGVSPRILHRYDRALLRAVHRGLEHPLNTRVRRRAPMTRSAIRSRCDRVLRHVRTVCAPIGIDPALVVSRSELTGILSSEEEGARRASRVFDGWRAALLGPEMLALLENHE